MIFRETLELQTRGKGTYEITDEVERILATCGITEGIVTIFNRHTSSSLVLMENADPSARADLENFLSKKFASTSIGCFFLLKVPFKK